MSHVSGKGQNKWTCTTCNTCGHGHVVTCKHMSANSTLVRLSSTGQWLQCANICIDRHVALLMLLRWNRVSPTSCLTSVACCPCSCIRQWSTMRVICQFLNFTIPTAVKADGTPAGSDSSKLRKLTNYGSRCCLLCLPRQTVEFPQLIENMWSNERTNDHGSNCMCFILCFLVWFMLLWASWVTDKLKEAREQSEKVEVHCVIKEVMIAGPARIPSAKC
jgi:hypothetical protein